MAAAVWFGAVLLTPGDVRQTLEMGRPHVDGLKDRLQKSVSISLRAGVLTVITGFGIIFASGGMGAVHFRIHIGMTLAILMLGVGFLMLTPVVNAICEKLPLQNATICRHQHHPFSGHCFESHCAKRLDDRTHNMRNE